MSYKVDYVVKPSADGTKAVREYVKGNKKKSSLKKFGDKKMKVKRLPKIRRMTVRLGPGNRSILDSHHDGGEKK